MKIDPYIEILVQNIHVFIKYSFFFIKLYSKFPTIFKTDDFFILKIRVYFLWHWVYWTISPREEKSPWETPCKVVVVLVFMTFRHICRLGKVHQHTGVEKCKRRCIPLEFLSLRFMSSAAKLRKKNKVEESLQGGKRAKNFFNSQKLNCKAV